jgi:hypothetical protein
MSNEPLEPLEKSISVSWDPATAFRRFTADFGRWWPRATHSIGGPRVKGVVFEQRVDGRIYEEHEDGRRFQWGCVVAWDPPRSVTFDFHPSRDPATAQRVEVRFVPESSGTRLEMTVTGWERWGRGAKRARRGYDVGWGYVLNVWAERRTGRMRVLDTVAAVMRTFELVRYRGRTGMINSAAGEISRA